MVLGTIHSLNHNSDSSQALFFSSQLHIYCNTCQVSTSCRFQFFIYTSLHFMEEIIWVVLKISGILQNHRSTKLEFQGFIFTHAYQVSHCWHFNSLCYKRKKLSHREFGWGAWNLMINVGIWKKKNTTQFYEFLIFSRQVENMFAFLSGLQSGEM